MSRADDDSDDEGLEGLSSLRSMFREMPDEEPPQRGLAELMAAARVKADEMAKPSLWERFLQTMRRPQVMALATIMILIGGAVFISQRTSEMDASPTAVQAEHEALEKNAATSTAGSATIVAQEAAKLDGEAKEEAAQAPGDMLGGDRGGQAAPVVATPPAATEPTRDEKRQHDAFGAKGGGGAATGASDAETRRKAATSTTKAERKATPKPPSKAPSKPRSSGTKSADSGLLLEGGFDDEPIAGAAPSPDPAPAPTTTDKPAAQPTAPSPAGPTTKQPATLSVQQLHANARKLAAAGDCAQVRTIAKQIAAKDAPYYRANIATDTSLASCLK